MNSSDKLSSLSPLVRSLTLAVIKNFRLKNIEHPRETIHADMVPKVSEKVMQSSLREKIISRENPSEEKELTKLIQFPRRISPPVQRVQRPPQQLLQQGPHFDSGEYGKLSGLFNDSSISSIECQGPGKPLLIIRMGQRQFTRINLSPKEIKEFLENVADKAKIPLMEGVFKAVLENFSINAVVSDLIGSRFVIKKQTPYSMLEKPQQP